MGRIMSFDYGSKRTGIAISDPLQIIASPYKTCGSSNVINFVKNYLQDNKIDAFVVGFPIDLKSKPTNSTRLVKKFVELLKKTFPLIPVKMIDERYTSKIASKAILDAGKNKKYRREKSNVDKVSASLILQSYLLNAKL